MFASNVLSVLFLSALATASPVEVQYPDFTPGPGLPSLAELNLTISDLHKPPEASALVNAGALGATLFDGGCGPSDSAYGNVNEVIAIYNYLRALGTRECYVAGGLPTIFATSGNSKVLGSDLTGRGTSSYCGDVSLGVLWVVDHCTRWDGSVAGFQAATAMATSLLSRATFVGVENRD